MIEIICLAPFLLIPLIYVVGVIYLFFQYGKRRLLEDSYERWRSGEIRKQMKEVGYNFQSSYYTYEIDLIFYALFWPLVMLKKFICLLYTIGTRYYKS